MVKSRTLTSYTYNEDIAEEISNAIYKDYYPVFIDLQKKFKELEKKE